MDNMQLVETFKNFLENNKSGQSYLSKEYKRLSTDISTSIVVDVRTGGASGGNCWNDDPAAAYREDREEIIDDINSSLLSAVKSILDELGVDKKQYEFVVSNLAYNQMDAEVTDRTEYEYYGNYTEYKLYAVTVSEIFEPLLTEDQKAIFNMVLEDFSNTSNKVFQNEKLSESVTQLEAKIKTFDAIKANEKKRMLDQMKVLEKSLENFDARTYKEKKSLKTQLESAQNELEKLNAPEPVVKAKAKKIKK